MWKIIILIAFVVAFPYLFKISADFVKGLIRAYTGAWEEFNSWFIKK